MELKLIPRISASAAKSAAGLRNVLNSTVSTLPATAARIIHHDLIIRLCGSSVTENTSTGFYYSVVQVAIGASAISVLT